MNASIQKQYKRIVSTFCPSGERAVNLLAYASFVQNVDAKPIWTQAFREALKEHRHLFLPKGKYYIDDTVILPSGTRIVAHKKAEICLVKGTKVVGFRSAEVIDGSTKRVDLDAPMSENITICGGIWSTEFTERAEYGKVGALDPADSMHGVHALMLFSGVRNLHLKRMTIKHAPAFALQLGRLDRFVVEDVRFVSCYADGVHVNGFVQNGLIRNVSGECGDDLVALNAYDWQNSTIHRGPIENVVVANVRSKGNAFHLMRLLPGVTSKSEGEIDCYIQDILISNIRGVSTYKLYLQTPSYRGTPEGASVGWMKNVTIQKLRIVKDRPSDQTPNYLDADPITGHFGVFELGSHIDGLTLRDIRVKFKCEEKYQSLAHLIVAGPKSCYLEKEHLEIFDPYVKSTVKNLAYRNIRVDGKRVSDLREHIKEISFEGLYASDCTDGFGKIESVRQIKRKKDKA
jgi:hypothetical protein